MVKEICLVCAKEVECIYNKKGDGSINMICFDCLQNSLRSEATTCCSRTKSRKKYLDTQNIGILDYLCGLIGLNCCKREKNEDLNEKLITPRTI